MSTPAETLETAIREFVNAVADEPTLVAGSVLLWEEVTINEDGDALRRMRYCIGTDGTPISAALGLCVAGDRMISRDVIDSREGDDID